VGVYLEFPKDMDKKINNISSKNKRVVYLIQFGFEAKLKSLEVLEILRKNYIAVKQDIGTDKLSDQMTRIAQSNILYTLIIGQKEALENSVIVRNNDNMSQISIPISLLNRHLKRLKLT